MATSYSEFYKRSSKTVSGEDDGENDANTMPIKTKPGPRGSIMPIKKSRTATTMPVNKAAALKARKEALQRRLKR